MSIQVDIYLFFSREKMVLFGLSNPGCTIAFRYDVPIKQKKERD